METGPDRPGGGQRTGGGTAGSYGELGERKNGNSLRGSREPQQVLGASSDPHVNCDGQ